MDAPEETPDDMVPAPQEGGPAPGIESEVVRTSQARVACDGGGELGHPQVWLNLGDEGRIACPYCSRVFVLEGSRHDEPEDGGG